MALETWFTKVKFTIKSTMHNNNNNNNNSPSDFSTATKKSATNILAFEIATLMSKLLHLWRSLSDSQIHRLRNETIYLQGVRKVVSDDDGFLLALACAELSETVRHVAEFVTNLSTKCADQHLRQFDLAFKSFAHSGSDANRWVMSWKEMDAKARKMDRWIASTTILYKEMDDVAESERGLKKLVHSSHHYFLKGGGGGGTSSKIANIQEVQHKIFWKKQEIKYLKQTSLWGTTFDTAISLLARSCFTILARIKHVFGIPNHESNIHIPPIPWMSAAAVYPSSETPQKQDFLSSGPLVMMTKEVMMHNNNIGLLDLILILLVPPESTLGASALALHYANVIIVIEKMIKMPRAVGPDARDDLYGMLPASVRGLLRRRLRGVGWGAARDVRLAAEWRAALDRMVEWLGPVATNTVRWQGERSIERRRAGAAEMGNKGGNVNVNVLLLQTLYFANREKVEDVNVLLLQTLYFANREKVEAAIVELLISAMPIAVVAVWVPPI